MRHPAKSLFAIATVTLVATTTRAAGPVPAPIRVAIYDDGGGGGGGPANVEKCLARPPGGFKYRRLSAADIRAGALAGVDVLVQPGGSGSKQAAVLQAAGRDAIRDFVKNGGGYVGICAGSYLATTDYPWSLGILNARVVDRQHWARGTGDVRIRITDQGKTILDATDDVVTVYYGQGPLLAPGATQGLAAYTPLALYETEMTRKGPEGVMKGTTAIAAAPFGRGRVICISPHPEKKDGLEGFVRRAVTWVATREPASSPPPAH